MLTHCSIGYVQHEGLLVAPTSADTTLTRFLLLPCRVAARTSWALHGEMASPQTPAWSKSATLVMPRPSSRRCAASPTRAEWCWDHTCTAAASQRTTMLGRSSGRSTPTAGEQADADVGFRAFPNGSCVGFLASLCVAAASVLLGTTTDTWACVIAGYTAQGLPHEGGLLRAEVPGDHR